MSLHIGPVSVDDPASVDAWVRVMDEVRVHEFAHFPRVTRRAGEAMLRHPFPARGIEHHVAWLDGEPVARLETSWMTEENLKVLFFTLEVVPRFRRRGVGRALYGRVLECAAEQGRTVLLTGSSLSKDGLPAPDEAPAGFAAALGFASTLPEVQRRLVVANVDEDVLTGMAAAARDKAAGYRVVQWRDGAPAELAERVAYLDSRLISDAPMGDMQVEPEQPDVARMRQIEAVLAGRGRRLYHTGAVHEDTGDLVAWTTISTGTETPGHAWQQITIVDPKHRGHRLGALVKVANLRHFRAAEPEVTVIDTFNAAENSFMISINEQMGFRRIAAFQNWQRELEGSAEPAA